MVTIHEERQTCPVMSVGFITENRDYTSRLFCDKEKCAWWCEGSEHCAIKEIALKKTK